MVVMNAYSAGYRPYLIAVLPEDRDCEGEGYNPFYPYHFRRMRQAPAVPNDPEWDEEFGDDADWGIERAEDVPISIFKLDD